MLSREILLPMANRSLARYTLPDAPRWTPPESPIQCRVAYAAAHVVADPLHHGDPITESALDWESTLAYRRLLWSYGLGVAEAMDTSQRGMGLDWNTAIDLIRRSVAEAKTSGGRIACGAGTDHLEAGKTYSLDDIVRAYELQCAEIEGCGGRLIIMASRALAATARTPEDYRLVYGRILKQAAQPVILHWLGVMFDPALANYWGCSDVHQAIDICLGIIRDYSAKVDGIKISLLDRELEILMRRQLPTGVRMYTGDDFGYDELIRGDEHGHSDALLGIFDPIAPAASAALQALDRGDTAEYDRILGPTVPLSRTIFESPTYSYKTGIVFLAYLNGYQRHFRMVAGRESARSVVHLSRVMMQAADAGLIIDPELATQRMRTFLAQAGVS